MQRSTDKKRFRLVETLIETFGFSPWLASIVALFLVFLGAAALVWLWLSAPPREITITSGPAGSSFQRNADAYRVFLEKKGVRLKVLPSSGSLDNLKRLQTHGSGVDVGFVQDGLVEGENPPANLVSLGTISIQPLWIFYRGAKRMELLSELSGKRVGVGAAGSGTHSLALALLQANQIVGAPAPILVEEDADAASAGLLAGKLDAIFLMGDSAPIETLRTILHTDGVQLFEFTQADAYVRKITYLTKITLPRGALDIGKDLPAHDVTLVGPAVELVARKDLNSAISDQLIAAAQFVHGKTSILRKKGEFPNPTDRDFTLSDDALRYYKSGQNFTYKVIDSFWVASLVNRLLVAIVPLILVLIPAVRLLPLVYKWSVQLKIYRCYRPLLRLERSAEMPLSHERAQELMEHLDEIEKEVNGLKVPASFASQFYALREHVDFVRLRLKMAVAT